MNRKIPEKLKPSFNMDKNNSAKQSAKKSSTTVDKNRKSSNKKKKKIKKPLSAKSDQSPDLEVEGVRALDQNGKVQLVFNVLKHYLSGLEISLLHSLMASHTLLNWFWVVSAEGRFGHELNR